MASADILAVQNGPQLLPLMHDFVFDVDEWMEVLQNFFYFVKEN